MYFDVDFYITSSLKVLNFGHIKLTPVFIRMNRMFVPLCVEDAPKIVLVIPNDPNGH